MKIGFTGFSVVTSTPQIFRGQGAVCRWGKPKLVRRRKSNCRLLMWVLCLLWKGWSISPQSRLGSCVSPSYHGWKSYRTLAGLCKVFSWSGSLGQAPAKTNLSKRLSLRFMLMVLPPVCGMRTQLTSLRPSNLREGSSYRWNMPWPLGTM